MKHNLPALFATLSLLLSFAILGLIAFWKLYPYKIMDIKNQPFPILNENKTVKQGDRLIYAVDACKYTDLSPDLKKFFVDGVIYEVSNSIGAIDKGCRITNVDTYVPRAIPAGHYRMKMVARYKVNPIRTIEIINYSDYFNVIK